VLLEFGLHIIYVYVKMMLHVVQKLL